MDTKPFALLGALAGITILLGLWLFVFSGDNNNDGTAGGSGPASPTETITVAADTATPAAPAAPAVGGTGGSSVTVTVPYPAGEEPKPPADTFPPGLVNYDIACDTTAGGFGVEWRTWGSDTSGILLPYALGWPVNEPGMPPVCAPNTDFGAAIVATHILYVEDLTPGWIPDMAIDTPGRQTRLNRHQGPRNPADLGFICEPLGWSRVEGRGPISLYHRCGDFPVYVSVLNMDWRDGRWQLVYTPTGMPGQLAPAEPGDAYIPFGEGGG